MAQNDKKLGKFPDLRCLAGSLLVQMVPPSYYATSPHDILTQRRSSSFATLAEHENQTVQNHEILECISKESGLLVPIDTTVADEIDTLIRDRLSIKRFFGKKLTLGHT